LSPNEIDTTILCVEAAKWGVVAIALIALRAKAAVARDAEIFALLVVLISNLGVWVGGYSLIFYATLLPVFLKMRARVLYVGALALIALPLDIIPLRGDFIGMQYSYLADSRVDIYWTLGLGSLLRPFVNLALLLVLSLEFLNRRVKSSGEIPYAASTAVWKKPYRKIHQDAQA
jgi:hypothetical protein